MINIEDLKDIKQYCAAHRDLYKKCRGCPLLYTQHNACVLENYEPWSWIYNIRYLKDHEQPIVLAALRISNQCSKCSTSCRSCRFFQDECALEFPRPEDWQIEDGAEKSPYADYINNLLEKYD